MMKHKEQIIEFEAQILTSWGSGESPIPAVSERRIREVLRKAKV